MKSNIAIYHELTKVFNKKLTLAENQGCIFVLRYVVYINLERDQVFEDWHAANLHVHRLQGLLYLL